MQRSAWPASSVRKEAKAWSDVHSSCAAEADNRFYGAQGRRGATKEPTPAGRNGIRQESQIEANGFRLAGGNAARLRHRGGDISGHGRRGENHRGTAASSRRASAASAGSGSTRRVRTGVPAGLRMFVHRVAAWAQGDAGSMAAFATLSHTSFQQDDCGTMVDARTRRARRSHRRARRGVHAPKQGVRPEETPARPVPGGAGAAWPGLPPPLRRSPGPRDCGASARRSTRRTVPACRRGRCS